MYSFSKKKSIQINELTCTATAGSSIYGETNLYPNCEDFTTCKVIDGVSNSTGWIRVFGYTDNTHYVTLINKSQQTISKFSQTLDITPYIKLRIHLQIISPSSGENYSKIGTLELS